MIPNLFAKMAEAPALLQGYWQLSLKTLSNYKNHLANTERDGAFVGRTWAAPASEKAQ